MKGSALACQDVEPFLFMRGTCTTYGGHMSQVSDKQWRVICINAIANISLAITKIVVGFLFQSQLLVADGVHSASDLLTDLFAMIGLHIAKQPKDEEHPFGHGSLEYATSLTVSVFIFFMAYELIVELVVDWHVFSTHISHVVLWVSFITFIVKLLLSAYVLYKAEKLDSHTLKSSGTESLADAYSTIIVIVGLLLTDYGINEGIAWLLYAEKIATIVVILMLIRAAYQIYFTSIVGIAGAQASAEVQEQFFASVKDTVLENEGVFELTEFIVLKRGIDYGVYIKLVFKQDMSLKEASQILKGLKTILYADSRVKIVNVDFSTVNEGT